MPRQMPLNTVSRTICSLMVRQQSTCRKPYTYSLNSLGNTLRGGESRVIRDGT